MADCSLNSRREVDKVVKGGKGEGEKATWSEG